MRVTPRLLYAGLGLAAWALAAAAVAPAWAQSDETALLRDRVARLEQQLETLRRLLEQRAPAPRAGAAGDIAPTVAAAMELRLGALEAEIRRLTGQVEELGFALRKARERMEALASDMDFRLGALERRGGPAAGPAAEAASAPAAGETAGTAPAEGAAGPEQAAGAAPAEGAAAPAETAALVPGILPPGPPAKQYQYARALLKRTRYEQAEKAFEEFIAAHPDTPLTANAIYWLGEIAYVQGDYAQAAVRFAEGYKKFPDHAKGPDNLLKLGMSLARLAKVKEACASFAQLDRQYENAAPIIKQRAAAERKRIRCP